MHLAPIDSNARMLLPLCSAWWDELEAPVAGAEPPSAASARELRARADELAEVEQQAFDAAQARSHGSDHRFVSKLLSTGTVKDRVAALQLQVHESSFHSLPYVRQLVTLVQRPAREVKLVAVTALLDVMHQRLLPARLLLPFQRQPLGESPSSRQLLQARFEDELRSLHRELVECVCKGTSDSVIHVRQRMMSSAHWMLTNKPEGERVLLPALVNKLGDPDKKVASRATHLLGLLANEHPAMKPVLLGEVQRFVLRANVGERAQYYATIFMNQMVLTSREPQTARTLLLVYLSLFGARATGVGTLKTALDTRMLSALLAGIHRAVPFCDAEATEPLKRQLDAVFRCTHAPNFSVAVQALQIVWLVSQMEPETSDRFYTALYDTLLHSELVASSKLALFLNVVYKAMRADKVPVRQCAFSKRLLQLASVAPATLACATLLLLSEVAKGSPAVAALISEPPSSGSVVVDRDDFEVGSIATANGKNGALAEYDPRKRNPAHTGAEHSRLWELALLCHHFHPSVSQFAASLRAGQGVSYGGDPLADFQLGAFLDRFVFKNPKRGSRDAGGSIMQPVTAQQQPSLAEAASVRNLLQKAPQKVAAHERFLRTYFEQKAAASKSKKARPVKQSDEGNDEEEAFARDLAESMLSSKAGVEEDDDDFGMIDDDDDDDIEDDDDEEDTEALGALEFDSDDGGSSVDDDVARASKRDAEGDAGGKRKKRKGPTFADAEEFAHILEDAAADGAAQVQEDRWQQRREGYGKGKGAKGRGVGRGRGTSARGREKRRF